MKKNDMSNVCSQLLDATDLEVSKDTIQEVLKSKILTKLEISESKINIVIYSLEPIYLSTITPILFDFSFFIKNEISYQIQDGETNIYISKFNINIDDSKKALGAKENIEKIISLTLKGEGIGRCKLFTLVYCENLNIRQILLIRSFIEYINQSVLSINLDTIVTTMVNYPDISAAFINYFETKFNPKTKSREHALHNIESYLAEAIKNVPNITDDKILKIMSEMLKSLLRTNYFFDKESIAFKIDVKCFSSHLKGIQPNIEAFVYHPEFNGLHLRMSKISRGGLRWSERHDDYRQEIKSLMITQEGKNSIIIPDGAKGGFVIKKDSHDVTPDYFKEIYSNFINNLLDLVDNVVNHKVVKNKNMICYDEDDTYFVVAADKGTSHMSDVANSIAIERGYWLGDAFASGGSNGFGHKELGITARGAMVSTERFFIENGINIQEQSVSVVGIGSMKGDVFGNGMLYSPKFSMLGAISHKEIFIDPKPDIEVAHKERERLFSAKNGGWSGYDKSKISAGGGVFLRSDKSIELSPEIKKMLHTQRATLSGEELAKMLLQKRVDLLFNGGVGTYFKSSEENNIDLGDKQNEAVRVDADKIKAKVVCEGGNLGFTQKARIEYALGGGKINIDGIDNAGGVDTSDHEVNLKIFLNTIESDGVITKDEKEATLKGLTEQVVSQVLWSTYLQSLAISRDERQSATNLDDFIQVIETIESQITTFKRKEFYIPKNDNMHEILTNKGAIVRPILSTLLSYSKIFVKTIILESDLHVEKLSHDFLLKYFPKSFISVYEHKLLEHPLKKEIIATKIADEVINKQGVTFIADYMKLGKERFLNKIRSFIITNQLFGANDINFEIYRHDLSMPVETQYKLLNELENTILFSTNWMLKYLKNHEVDYSHILEYKEQLFELLPKIPHRNTKNYIEDNIKFNQFFETIDYLKFAIATIMVKKETTHSYEDVAHTFFLIIQNFKIIDMMELLDNIQINEKNEKSLKKQLFEFLEFATINYTQKIITFQRINETPQESFTNYILNNQETLDRVGEQIDSFIESDKKSIQDINIIVNRILASVIRI
ncbi:MAG: NAD-glutamate dehydrogenase [Campylobacterota bacterium]|nr:NAD-glutamate dehydrogenase [Campylobacterota bacterium]